MTRTHISTTAALAGATLASAALLITSCTSDDTGGTGGQGASSSAASSATAEGHEEHGHDHDHGGEFAAGEGETEVASLPSRILYSYDGGLKTLDATSGEVIGTEKLDGLLRLNNGGDNRHVFVTRGDYFQSYDMGLITKPHGDHNHYYKADPKLLDTTFDAPHAGHVVNHDGMTALFSDGDGTATVLPADQAGQRENTTTFDSGAPHHGVAVPFKDGSVLITVGTEKERHTIRHVDKDNKTLAETTDCPGVHGEAVAGNGNVVFGCENGPVIFDGKDFKKADVAGLAGADGYQRSGTLAGSEESDVVLADNKTDKTNAEEKGAKKERPTSVSLVDTKTGTAKPVELGASYWFRSLARGPLGEALVLTTDGNLNVIDPDSGEVTKKIKAIGEWKEKDDWQQPGPILKSEDGYAYITDANTKELVVIDLYKGEEARRFQLDEAPTEMSVL